MSVLEFYAVEGGDRPTSLDTHLFNECKKFDISFEFNSSLNREDLENLAPNMIFTCGLSPSACEMLDIPCLRWYGWISRG